MIQIPCIFEQGPKQEGPLQHPYTTVSSCLEDVTNTPGSGEEVANEIYAKPMGMITMHTSRTKKEGMALSKDNYKSLTKKVCIWGADIIGANEW